MKISEAFADYQRIGIRGRGCSANTDRAYEYTKRVMVEYFGDVNIRKLKLEDVSNFYLDLTEPRAGTAHQRIISKNTARAYVSKLRTVLRFCQKRGLKVVDPDEIALPRLEKKVARFVDYQQYEAFLKEIGRPRRGYSNLNRVRNVLICKMLFNTGLRVGELCALDRDSIRNRQFVVIGKSKDPRPCFITREIEKDVEDYLAMRHDNNPALFVANETGKRITPHNVQNVFRRTARATGLTKVTPHTLRHSYATRLLEDGVDIRYVAAFLGHQSLDTTRRYTHVRDFKMYQIYQNVIEKC